MLLSKKINIYVIHVYIYYTIINLINHKCIYMYVCCTTQKYITGKFSLNVAIQKGAI